MPSDLTVGVPIERLRAGQRTRVGDVVAIEEPMEIRVAVDSVAGDAEQDPAAIAVTMRTPGHDFALAVGFLFTEGIIQGAHDVDRVSYCVDGFVEQQYNVVNVYLRQGVDFDRARLARSFYVTSSCGVCGKGSLDALRVHGCAPVPPGPVIAATTLRALPQRLRVAQAAFDATGGLHAAGLFSADGQLLLLREDVGRHNAVDKVVGERLLSGAGLVGAHVLLVSGRASFEILQKAAVAGIPIVAAIGAPSSLAVATAEEFGMTLVGFLRSDGFNIYAGAERVAP